MSLKSLVSGSVVLALVLGILAVVTPFARASHRGNAITDPQCSCRASLHLSRPSLQWTGGVLTFIPRVDVHIRGRGDAGAPPLDVSVNYEGSTGYSSEDVAVPSGVSFSGSRAVVSGMPCDGRYRFQGLDLAHVGLTGITPSLVGEDQELEGKVDLQASVAGCGFDSDHRALRFRVLEFGNIRIGSWRSAR